MVTLSIGFPRLLRLLAKLELKIDFDRQPGVKWPQKLVQSSLEIIQCGSHKWKLGRPISLIHIHHFDLNHTFISTRSLCNEVSKWDFTSKFDCLLFCIPDIFLILFPHFLRGRIILYFFSSIIQTFKRFIGCLHPSDISIMTTHIYCFSIDLPIVEIHYFIKMSVMFIAR